MECSIAFGIQIQYCAHLTLLLECKMLKVNKMSITHFIAI